MDSGTVCKYSQRNRIFAILPRLLCETSLNTITFSELYLNDAPSADVTMNNVTTAIAAPPKQMPPTAYDLVGAYPNPFNPSTRIVFQTPNAAQVHLEIFNSQGARVKVLTDAQVIPDSTKWSGTGRTALDRRWPPGRTIA